MVGMKVSGEISGAGKMSNDAVIYGFITASIRKDPCVNLCSEHLCASYRPLTSLTQKNTRRPVRNVCHPDSWIT